MGTDGRNVMELLGGRHPLLSFFLFLPPLLPSLQITSSLTQLSVLVWVRLALHLDLVSSQC